MIYTIRDIPGRALFYDSKETREGLYEVYVETENGIINDEIKCRLQDSVDGLIEVERYFSHLVEHVSDLSIKRLILENLIRDCQMEISAYGNEIATSSPEELERTWGPRDPKNWRTMLYPTRLELLEGNMKNTIRELKECQKMLDELESGAE
ncbi:hypothetical protein [Gorillibacterium sp. sgz5001074]|uniref:hypothetical protein n=1 Tax=Gorillibacterium sp. sgz5001074 TaxID=3446695 RepID=UPI003F662CDB